MSMQVSSRVLCGAGPAGRRRWSLRLCAAALTVVAGPVGCSASSAFSKAGDTGFGAGDVESDGGGGADTGQDQDPAWWSLALEAAVVDGAPQPAGSSLELAWLNRAGDTICGGTSSLLTVQPASLEAEGVFSWWELEAGAWSTDCPSGLRESPVGSSPFYVGVGGLHVELLARMGAETVDAALSDNLNGAYLARSTSGPVYAFGLAGPEGAFDGTTAAQSAAPLADGTWTIVPLYPLP